MAEFSAAIFEYIFLMKDIVFIQMSLNTSALV